MGTIRQLFEQHSERAGAGPALLAGLLLSLSLAACGSGLGDPLQAIDAPSDTAGAGDLSSAPEEAGKAGTDGASGTESSAGAHGDGSGSNGSGSNGDGSNGQTGATGSGGSSDSGGSSGSAVKQQPDPQPEQPERPKPQEPKQPKPSEPTRQGAPYDIEPFDNIGGPLNNFRDAVESRCSGEGSACLKVVENNAGDDSDPTLCIVQTISYSPAPGPEDAPEGERKLQRGTTVTVDSDCNPPDEGGSDG
jgi:hypothetical protein